MVGFLLFGILFTVLILIGGVVAWGRAAKTGNEESTRRTRSEAREIQTRFEGDEDFSRNFQRPTQNEVLETLQMLDHLSPGWDQGDAALADQRLKNELAESFPTLQRAGCLYPQEVAANSLRGLGKKPRDQAAQTATRQKFRAERAQANALHQLTSAGELGPVAVTPGSLPFRVSEGPPPKRISKGVRRVALATTALGLAAGGWYFVGNKPHPGKPSSPLASTNQITASDDLPPVGVDSRESTPIPLPSDTAASNTADGNTVQNSPSPIPPVSPGLADAAPSPAGAEAPSPARPIDPAPALPKVDAALAKGVAASKERAVDLYPDLAVPNSEINLRFVFRYKALLAEKSARLQDPSWPEKLAAECARAANGTLKPKKTTSTAPKPR